MVKATPSGNLAKLGASLLTLGETLAEVTQPEFLLADVANQAAMTAIQEAVKTAAHICGFNAIEGWMKDTLGALSVASNFTSFGNAAKEIVTEVLAHVAGQKGPLQSQWDDAHPDEPEDQNYKKTQERHVNQDSQVPISFSTSPHKKAHSTKGDNGEITPLTIGWE